MGWSQDLHIGGHFVAKWRSSVAHAFFLPNILKYNIVESLAQAEPNVRYEHIGVNDKTSVAKEIKKFTFVDLSKNT